MSETEAERKWRHIAQDADTVLLEILKVVPNPEGLGELIEAVKLCANPTTQFTAMEKAKAALRACEIEVE